MFVWVGLQGAPVYECTDKSGMAGLAIILLNRRKYKCFSWFLFKYFTEGILMVSTQDPLLPLEVFCLLQVTRRMFWVSLSIYVQIPGELCGCLWVRLYGGGERLTPVYTGLAPGQREAKLAPYKHHLLDVEGHGRLLGLTCSKLRDVPKKNAA